MILLSSYSLNIYIIKSIPFILYVQNTEFVYEILINLSYEENITFLIKMEKISI